MQLITINIKNSKRKDKSNQKFFAVMDDYILYEVSQRQERVYRIMMQRINFQKQSNGRQLSHCVSRGKKT